MSLVTMEPEPTWDAEAHAETVETLAGLDEDVVFRVWGGDWCGDCRAQLPAFGAALEAAGIGEDRVEHYPVEREDGEKVGPGVEAYDVAYIPTVVVERVDGDGEEGEELARFVEEENRPIAVWLADELREAGATA